jgi:hypothetical protein
MDPADEPPARLRAFDPADWLPLVDPSEYHEDDWRNRRDHVPYGPVKFSFENWRLNEAWNLFGRARSDWHREHGWPGGLDFIELFRETVQMHRRSTVDPFPLEHG